MFWKKKKQREPENARFMIDRGPDCWVVFQKIDQRWVHRGNFNTHEAALAHMYELNDYPKYYI